MDWRRLRQQGFLTLAIVLAATVILAAVLPNMDLRQAILTVAIIAFLIGWIP